MEIRLQKVIAGTGLASRRKAEEWIAAYRMVPEGRGFPGVTPALKSMIGLPPQRNT